MSNDHESAVADRRKTRPIFSPVNHWKDRAHFLYRILNYLCPTLSFRGAEVMRWREQIPIIGKRPWAYGKNVQLVGGGMPDGFSCDTDDLCLYETCGDHVAGASLPLMSHSMLRASAQVVERAA